MIEPNQFSVVFPGQGSQYLGMLSSYFDNCPTFQETFEESSKLLGVNYIDLLITGTKEDLAKTEITQPLMLIADVALWNEGREPLAQVRNLREQQPDTSALQPCAQEHT